MKFRVRHYFWLTNFLFLLILAVNPLLIDQNNDTSDYWMMDENNGREVLRFKVQVSSFKF